MILPHPRHCRRGSEQGMSMFNVVAAAALAVSGLSADAAVGDSPVSLPQLAPGEVLLSVNGLGNVRSPATLATVSATADARGATEAEARQALQAKIREMTAAARAAGAGADDIRVAPEAVSEVDETLGMRDFQTAEPDEAAAAAARRYYGRTAVTVRLRNVGRAQALNARFNSFSTNSYPYFGGGGPIYELIDESGARRAARTQAISNARADAESYAAALNLRIVRVLQVTERGGLDFLSMTVSESNALIGAMRSFSSAQAEAQVETYAVVGVDFVLAPR
jgi:hypothetical protein